MKPLLELRVPGLPIAQGSKRHVGNGLMIESNEDTLKPWRATITAEASLAFDPDGRGAVAPVRDAVRVSIAFAFPRPASHYGTGRNAGTLKPSAPAYKTTKPDVDKLARAVLDALTGIVFVDDSQVAELVAVKSFGPRPGVWIRVEFADEFAELAVPLAPVEA